MIFFPIENVFIEGSDCSGKTSLISTIHKKTSYQWHLMDRSQLSRSIFAKMYNREIPGLKENQRSETYNLNNFTIILAPPRDEIIKRFKRRGDEIHDLESLLHVYESFLRSISSVISFPHFHIPGLTGKETPEEIGDNVCKILSKRESQTISGISNLISDFANACPRNEACGLSLKFYEDLGFEHINTNIMELESEREYYREIHDGLLRKIKLEIAGENEYRLPQTLASRRFIYTNDSCISFIHVTCRDNILDFHTVFRSTDVQDKLFHDLEFIYYLSSQVYKILKTTGTIKKIRYRLFFNSAHILKSFNPAC